MARPTTTTFEDLALLDTYSARSQGRSKPPKEKPNDARHTPISDLPQLLTVRQVADILGYHPETVRGWLRSGRLPGVNTSSHLGIRGSAGRGGWWRVSRSVIEQIVREANERAGPDQGDAL